MIVKNEKPLAAISYNTRTFEILEKLVLIENPNLNVTRIEPNIFEKELSDNFQYINLVIRDWEERKHISHLLDQHNHDRWSYVDTRITTNDFTEFGPGCFIFPGVISYYGKIGKDVIMHGRVSLAENVTVGDGCFFSGSCTIAGSTTIGNWCNISINVVILDNLTIADNVKLLPSMTVRKSIKKSGSYFNPYSMTVKPFKELK